MSAEAIPDALMRARFRQVASELAPEPILPKTTSRELVEFMSEVFEKMRLEMEPLLGPVNIESGIGAPLTQEDAKFFESQGYTDCSGGNKDGVSTFVKIDYAIKRSFLFFKLPNLPFPAESFLPLPLEASVWSKWFPFCKKSAILGEMTAPIPFARLVQFEVGPPGVTFEMLSMVVVQDQLQEENCLQIILCSPPEEVMRRDKDSTWLEQRIPGNSSSWLKHRIPWEWTQISIYPTSPKSCDLVIVGKSVDLVPPPSPALHFMYRMISRRIYSIFCGHVAGIDKNEVGKVTKEHPALYTFMGDRLSQYWERKSGSSAKKYERSQKGETVASESHEEDTAAGKTMREESTVQVFVSDCLEEQASPALAAERGGETGVGTDDKVAHVKEQIAASTTDSTCCLFSVAWCTN